jgi:hypothetical protein
LDRILNIPYSITYMLDSQSNTFYNTCTIH